MEPEDARASTRPCLRRHELQAQQFSSRIADAAWQGPGFSPPAGEWHHRVARDQGPRSGVHLPCRVDSAD